MTEQKVFEVDAECDSCKSTGIYRGLAEGKGIGVVCNICKGTGCRKIQISYMPFESRKVRDDVKQVIQVNPGIGTGQNSKFLQSHFGGMRYTDWFDSKAFPVKSEMRIYCCPAWWYQSVDYKKKPKWEKCLVIGSFSSCEHFGKKDLCWDRWDKEFGLKG